jgi:hypothetical protein
LAPASGSRFWPRRLVGQERATSVAPAGLVPAHTAPEAASDSCRYPTLPPPSCQGSLFGRRSRPSCLPSHQGHPAQDRHLRMGPAWPRPARDRTAPAHWDTGRGSEVADEVRRHDVRSFDSSVRVGDQVHFESASTDQGATDLLGSRWAAATEVMKSCLRRPFCCTCGRRFCSRGIAVSR